MVLLLEFFWLLLAGRLLGALCMLRQRTRRHAHEDGQGLHLLGLWQVTIHATLHLACYLATCGTLPYTQCYLATCGKPPYTQYHLACNGETCGKPPCTQPCYLACYLATCAETPCTQPCLHANLLFAFQVMLASRATGKRRRRTRP